jgi:DNA-binding transcriptional regulator YdaS (Cro superfamily)
MTLTQKGETMTLTEFFVGKPRGAKIELARKLGISKTWLSLVISGRQLPSPELARDIEVHTGRKVKRADLRPDIFGKTAK